MLTFIIAFLIVALLVIASAMLGRHLHKDADEGPWPYYSKKPLSQPEQILYHRLVAALPECIVLSQVHLSRILAVKKGAPHLKWYNRISPLSVDFLVCLKDSTIVAAIELDDKTHEQPARMETDSKKAKALYDAGVTLIRWQVNAIPNEAEIRKEFSV